MREVAAEPKPLPIGTVLDGRFEVLEVLGRGGFGTVYRANDLLRRDQAVVKELTPPGSVRMQGGVLSMDAVGAAAAQRLRQRFLEEAKVLGRLNLPGVLGVRAAFSDLGTAYYATDYIPNSSTLERLQVAEGRMDTEGALDIVFQLLETLEGIHSKGFLHRDIKPSNVLISDKGEAFLIDFGAAREWHADVSQHHTVLYTPGYAPLEQMSEKAKRGPATDLHALCATAYKMITGAIPTGPTERLQGVALIPIRSIRPDVEPRVARALEKGLEVRYADRPQSVHELRELLEERDDDTTAETWEDRDAKLVRLKKFSFERRQCPACGGVLEEPKPLKPGVCPVCWDGIIRKRIIHDRLCPVCKSGPLKLHRNSHAVAVCPVCCVGWMQYRKKGILSKESIGQCEDCEAQFDVSGGRMTLVDLGKRPRGREIGESHSLAEWVEISGRADEIWGCDSCPGQFDVLPDGRWEQIVPDKPKPFDALYPEEWARVAAGIEPSAGNAACDSCEADYFLEGDQLTLLSFHFDPHQFGQEHLGRLTSLEEVRWSGVGKESSGPGYVCGSCHTEFDRDGDYWRLIKTPNRKLLSLTGEIRKPEDWHRLGAGLPAIQEEDAYADGLTGMLVAAYESGELPFDSSSNLLWRGPASRDGSQGNLTVSPDEIVFGGLLRKWRVPFDAIVDATAQGNRLELLLSGEKEPTAFEIEPQNWSAELASGDRTAELRASNLAKRIRFERGG